MKFRCDCGQTLNATKALIGEEILCPGCQASVRVPDPGVLAAKAEELQRAKAQRKKKKEKKARPSGVAAVFNQFGDILFELLDNHRPLLIRSAGFIFGPLLLLVFSAVYFKPVAITQERVQKIQLGMTLKQVEAIVGTTHARYRDPRPKEVFVFNTRELVDYSRDHSKWSNKNQPDARLWHDGWFVTGNNATRSIFITFHDDSVSSIIWRELDGKKLTTHFPFATPGSIAEIVDEGGQVQYKLRQ